MERVKFFYCLSLGIILAISSVSAQRPEREKEIIKQELRTAVDSGNYIIEINKAHPTGGKTIDLTSGYRIEIKNDSLFSYLPYFGKASMAPYGGGKGLIFNAPLTKYKAIYRPKRKIKIDFTVRNEEDIYFFHLIIHENSKAYLTVYPTNKQMISYTGYVQLPALAD